MKNNTEYKNNPFKIPVSTKPSEQPSELNVKSSELEELKATTSLPSKKPVIRFNLERTAVVKVGFDLPEEDDYDIEIIAVKEKKQKKVLLAEIVKDWLKKNKHKKD